MKISAPIFWAIIFILAIVATWGLTTLSHVDAPYGSTDQWRETIDGVKR